MRLPGDGSAIPMTAAGGDSGLGEDAVRSARQSRARGLPVQRSTIVVTSALTGECIALLDGRAITAIRTAAVSAVATDHLARRSASVLGLVGAGNLAIEHAHAIAAVRDIDAIVVWTRSDATLEAFRAATEDLGIPIEPAASAEAVVAAADIVCTLTPAREPVVRGAWLRPGQHVNAVGAPPRPDHREVDSEAMKRARVVVDSHSDRDGQVGRRPAGDRRGGHHRGRRPHRTRTRHRRRLPRAAPPTTTSRCSSPSASGCKTSPPPSW